MSTPAESATYSVPKPSLRRLVPGWRRRFALPVILPSVALVVFLFLWDWSTQYFQLPATLLPRPKDAFLELLHGVTSLVLINHTMVTLQEVVYGFAVGTIGGFVLGALVAESNYVRMTLYPFLVAIQMVPKVAIAPLFIIWLGYGVSSKVAFTAAVTFFPVVINTIAGLRSVDSDVLEMMKVFRASPWQTFYRVKLKFALPYIFASLEVAMVLSVIGAIVAEFVGSTKGLGYLILQAMHTLETAKVFAVLVMLALVGIVLSMAIRFAARKSLFWHESERLISH